MNSPRNFIWSGGYVSLADEPGVLINWVPGWESMPVEAPCQVSAITMEYWELIKILEQKKALINLPQLGDYLKIQ